MSLTEPFSTPVDGALVRTRTLKGGGYIIFLRDVYRIGHSKHISKSNEIRVLATSVTKTEIELNADSLRSRTCVKGVPRNLATWLSMARDPRRA